MSADIPFEIQEEIIKRILPVKSLLRFRSVSKQWKSLIGSSEFIMNHSVNQNHQHHILVRYEVDSEFKYVSIVDDDDSFPQHKFSPVVSPTVNLVSNASMLDSSHGLVCLYGNSMVHDKKNILVVWNPSIRKSVGVLLPYDEIAAYGFGVCPKTFDPKIVKIVRSETNPNDWEVEVFTLSSTAWRSKSKNVHLPLNMFALVSSPTVMDGVIHWLAFDPLTGLSDLIISFDLTSEEFGEVNLPNGLTHGNLAIFKRKESLAVLNYHEIGPYCECDIWVMIKNGDDPKSSSFAKLFTYTSEAYYDAKFRNIVGFRKNGQPIRDHPCRTDGCVTLEAYEPSTKHCTDLGISATFDSFALMTSYTESLLLLNHSNYIIHG